MFKKQSMKYHLTLLTALLALAGTILYGISVSVTVSQEVNVTLNAACLALLILGIAGCAAALAAMAKGIYKWWKDYLFLFPACFLAFGLMLCLKDRVYSMAILLGSELYATDAQAYTQLYIALGAMAAMLLAILVNCISGFLTFEKK